MSDRWAAFLAVLLMAGAIVGARALLHASSPAQALLQLPGLDEPPGTP